MVVCSYETQRQTHKGGGKQADTERTYKQAQAPRKDMTDKDKTSRHRKDMTDKDATNRQTQKGHDGRRHNRHAERT